METDDAIALNKNRPPRNFDLNLMCRIILYNSYLVYLQ